MHAQQRAQAAERLAWGAAWIDSGLVFANEDGSMLRPDAPRPPASRCRRTFTADTYTHVVPAVAKDAAGRMVDVVSLAARREKRDDAAVAHTMCARCERAGPSSGR
ncbi:MAG TPA: hypothetical protein VGX28_12055 [Frankiaceae bacterium]|nr:hypothetical protein [Frankiaceae bacterium]